MPKDIRKYADRAEYLKTAVKKRRKHLKQKAVEYKGGACILCGYNTREIHAGIRSLVEETH